MPKYTPETLRAFLLTQYEADYPRASKVKRAEFVDKIVEHESCGLPSFQTDHALLPLHKDFLMKEHGHLLRPVPSIEAVVASVVEKEAARLKGVYPDDPALQNPSAEWKLKMAREIQSWTDDQKLAAVPETAAPKAPASVAATAGVTMTTDDLDAEIFRRLGKTHHQIGAIERRKWHALLMDEQKSKASFDSNTASALAAVNGDFQKLPPEQRLALHRAAKNGG